MIRKLPPWVELGAFWLSIIAGTANAIGLFGFEHQAVSHLSGASTLLGSSIATGKFANLTHLALVVISFVLGAALSGLIVGSSALRLGKRYGAALLIEAMFFYISLLLLTNGSYYGQFFASAACGIQNALATTYSGAVVRTTHVSGIFTDLGVMLGSSLQGIKADARRAKLYLIIVCGFILGGTLGTYSFLKLKYFAFYIPTAMSLVLSLSYWTYWANFKYKSIYQKPDSSTS